MSLRASIVIVTYNRDKPLCETLRYFLPILADRDDVELVVVDQSPSHSTETTDYLKSIANKIRLFTVSFVGMTKARNFGVAHARGEIVIFTDDDVEPLEGFIDGHLAQYDDDQISGVSGCALAPGARQQSRSDLSTHELHRMLTTNYARFDLDFPREARWATGCNMSFRRQAIIKIGGFDESFYGAAIGEDAEFCYRLRSTGGRLQYAPNAILIHHACPSGGSRNASQTRARIIAIADNACYYQIRAGSYPLQSIKDLAWLYKALAFQRKAIPFPDILKRTWWFLTGLYHAWTRSHQPPKMRLSSTDWETSNWTVVHPAS